MANISSLSAYDSRILAIIRYRLFVTRHKVEDAVPDIAQRSVTNSLRRLEEMGLIAKWVTADHGAIYASAESAKAVQEQGLESKMRDLPARKTAEPPQPCGFCKQPIGSLDDALDHIRVHLLEWYYFGTVAMMEAVVSLLASLLGQPE